jgi:enoyl-CoA hydratase/carnithine racemase
MGDSSEEIVQVRYEGCIAVMTLNNPKRMNAFSLEMRRTAYERLLEIEGNDACRAVVLTGAGGHFCAGGDIAEMKRREVIEARMRLDLPTRLFRLLVDGPKPFVCAVEGGAFGCGMSFVAASDYAVAAADAKFSCAFIKVGLMPDFGGIWSIARKVGHRKAMELCAFGETFDAQLALDMQLINRICEPGHALAAALEAAEKFARNPPVAMALLKSALNTGNATVDQAVSTEVNYQSVLIHTEDFGEATRAFMEKRKPNFTGR